MQILARESVAARVRAQLAVKVEGAELDTEAAVAALIRRAAGFLCPCSPRTLVDAVVQSSAAWLGEEPRDRVKEVLSQLVTHGDLIESEPHSGTDASSGPARLYLAPPAFVLRRSGRIFLQGVVPDHPTGLPDELVRDLEESGFVRSLAPHAEDDWDDVLLPLGFVRLSSDHWFGAPAPTSAREHVTRYDGRLANSPVGGDPSGFEVLDPEGNRRFYRDRWKPAVGVRGKCVGRRNLPFGGRVWSYLELDGQRVIRVLDFPSGQIGVDEAWHLQMAMDACSREAQPYQEQVLGDPGGEALSVEIRCFGPLPSWAERRLEAVGERIPNSKGAMLTFQIPVEEAEEETEFLRRSLWLQVIQ